jgi:hypothetical protein
MEGVRPGLTTLAIRIRTEGFTVMAELLEHAPTLLEQALLDALISGDTEGAALIKGVIDRSYPLTAKGGAKAFASGMAKTLGDVLVGAGSAEAGPTMLLPEQQAAGIQAQEQAAKQASDNLGGGRLPLNTGERYLKSAGEGALPLPGPMMAAGAATGALGGLGAQWTREKNLGPVAELAAWMTPAFMASLGKSTMPGTPYKDIRRALGATSPEDSTAMVRRMQDAEARGVDLMPWQAAPEGSGLNTFGKGMALNPDAEQMQYALRQQTGKTGQPWVKAKTDPNFEALNQIPIAPDQAQSMRDALRGVVAKRSLHPASADAKAVENAATFFGKEAPGDVVAFVNQLQQEVSKATPGSPEYRAAIAKLMAAASGQLPDRKSVL